MADRKQDLIARVETARRQVLDDVAGLTAEQWARPSSNAGWSARDTLAHLSSIEARMRSMLGLVLEGRAWPADAPDLDTYNQRCVAERKDWPTERLVAELRSSGEETRRFLEGLAPADLDRRWTHPSRGELTVGEFAEIIPHHLDTHGAEIRAAARG